MHPALAHTAHRPWPIPTTPWTWRQSWCDLLFAHWPIDAALLRPLVPKELTVQEFDGTSWVGVVPFRMEGVMRRPLPDLPWISAFPELNLRIYVEHQEQPGVWFLSLDASNPLAVWGARTWFHLPYWRAKIDIQQQGERFDYHSQRLDGTRAALDVEFGPTGPVSLAQPGSLDHWLTERYCLYAQSPRGQLYRAEVHHPPWPLQPAKAYFTHNTLNIGHFPPLAGPPTTLHFARRVEVVVWNPERVT